MRKERNTLFEVSLAMQAGQVVESFMVCGVYAMSGQASC
jgi:hypothetical protein